jgi:ketosteroid isomerase-like protein
MLQAQPPLARFPRAVVVVVVAVALFAICGCGIGDGGSDEDDARDVVKSYAAAIADGDEAEVCDTLSEDSRKQFETADTTCQEAFKNFGGALSDEQKDKLKDIDPDVKVDGDTATAQVDEQPLEGEVRLKKEDGDWKVTIQQ